MVHQDFEKYANQRLMDGVVADNYKIFFKKEIDYQNKNLMILDFGCGDGKYFDYFKQFFPEGNIYGVEISKIRVERCKKRGWKNVSKINNLKKLPFNSNFFGFINFDQVIEHISREEIDFYLREFKRILKKGGKLIIMTPNYPVKRLYDFLNVFFKKDIKKLRDDPTHITHYNFNRLEKILRRYFSVVKLYPTGGYFYKFFKTETVSHKIIGLCIK